MAKDLYKDTKKNCIIAIVVLSLLLAACGAPSGKVEGNSDGCEDFDTPQGAEVNEEWPEEYYSCEVQELSGYLYEHTSISASPYASAEITIKDYEGEQLETDWDEPEAFEFSGEADVTWRFYNSIEEMGEVLNEAAIQEADGGSVHFLYYTFPMAENDHAMDLYHVLQRRFDTEEHPLAVWCTDNGKVLSFFQETVKEEDGYKLVSMRSLDSRVNLYVKDRTAYGLTLMNVLAEDDERILDYVFYDVFQHYGSRPPWSGWGLDEESLYWIDHNERLTELENPKRSFLEVRGIDENWEEAGDEGIMRYFGLLVEADYELPLTEDGRMLSLHFSLAEEDETSVEEEELELRYYLLNGYCMDEAYNMTVTDMETGEILQERSVSLSIELPDTITYPDLNGDGYADMRVGRPVHSSGSKAEEEGYTPPVYMLWNQQTEQFERKTEKEVENSKRAVANGLTEEEQEEKSKRERSDPFAPIQELTEWADPEDYIKLSGDRIMEYEVQEGDSLWRISERFYGTGYKWMTIVRAEDAPKDPNYLPVGETVFMPGNFYIRKDPYSMGGLRSEGSFQIEQPYGFAHYFLNGDLTYAPWEEENQIHSLPVTNPVGENPFHEPEAWEAFKAEAIRCSEELCPGRVSNLTFEKSHIEDGYDLYGYYFEYDTGEEIIEYVDFFKFGKNNMSEVIGVREQEPNTVLVNTVRYVAASFIDYGGEPGMGWGSGKIPNVGADKWDYPYLHNLFEAAREQFGTGD
ncbi:MAG: LysM peptidoglycan-binding domain-containing protein [Lachnospiraceae bacterium]|nr:LysM peptidoglycan-binding domain-containing protein [Lachnospiraceae bacterium]